MIVRLLQAIELLDALDTDKDGKVSAAEWVDGVSAVTQHLTQNKFEHLLYALRFSDTQTVDYCSSKDFEPIDSVEYLKSAVERQLKRGLATVCSQIAAGHATIASRKHWDADGCLPEGYLPFNPVRLLATWLQQNTLCTEIVNDDPRELDWSSCIPWESLTLERQLKAAFHHLDRQNSGYVQCCTVAGIMQYRKNHESLVCGTRLTCRWQTLCKNSWLRLVHSREL